MHVLVATDGELDTATASDFAIALAGPDGKVTVLTVIEIPRGLLSDLRAVMGQEHEVRADADAEYVGVLTPSRGDTPKSWPGDDAVIDRYLEDKCAQIARPLAKLIRDRGLDAEGIAVEGERAADAILAEAGERGADVIVVGSHGLGAFQGVLGSVGSRVVRRSRLPVLLIRVD